MNQCQIAATQETYDEYLVSVKRLVAYGEGTVDEASGLVKVPRQSIHKAAPEQYTKIRLRSGVTWIPCEEIIVTDTLADPWFVFVNHVNTFLRAAANSRPYATHSSSEESFQCRP